MVSFGSSGGRQSFQEQRRATADLGAAEAAERLVDADGRGVLVELGHDAFDTAEVLGSGVVVEAHAIADIEHRQRLGGVDRLQQLLACVDRVGDRDQMGVEFTSGDLVEQQPLGWRWRARLLAGRRGGVIQLP